MLKYIGLLIVLIVLLSYVLANKDTIVREHLANPTLMSLNKDLEKTKKKLITLNKEFQTMKAQAQAQSADAAAAKAQLAAIH